MAQNMPLNVVADQNYLVYLVVGNQLGASTEYVCYIKLGIQNEKLPKETIDTPSSLTPLCEYKTLIQDGKNWIVPLTFSLSGITIANNRSKIQSLTINNVKFSVDKIAQFDQDNNGYFCRIIIELWTYNPTSGNLEYTTTATSISGLT